MIGTARNMPVIPQTAAQKASARMITKELKLRVRPMSSGSIALPPMNWTRPTLPIVKIISPHELNCTTAMSDGRMVARIEPTLGMKLRKTVRSAQVSANSSPTSRITT